MCREATSHELSSYVCYEPNSLTEEEENVYCIIAIYIMEKDTLLTT